MSNQMTEKLPVSDKLTVLNSETLYKTAKWWCAVTYLESYGRKQVAVYLWIKNKTGKWRRTMKFIVYRKQDWERTKNAVEKFVQQLP